MAVPETPGRVLAVVAVLFADVQDVMRSGELVHHTDGVFVAGVRKLSSVQNADYGYVVAFHAAVDGQPVVGARFLLVVVNMGVARIPVVFLRYVPSVERDFDVSAAVFGHVHHRPQGSYSVPRSTRTSVRPRPPRTSNVPSLKKNGVPGPRLSTASRGCVKRPSDDRT